MLLHTVNKSVFDNTALDDCLYVVAKSDAVLLIENGVYSALNNLQRSSTHLEKIQQLADEGTRFYLLQADCEARGLVASSLLPAFTIINDTGFVSLAAEASAIQSWY